MKKNTIFAVAIMAALLAAFAGCKKSQEKKTRPENMSLPPSLRKLDESDVGYIEGKSIVIVLGYGFNEATTVEKIKADLDSEFSLKKDDEGGFVSVYVFPDDFMSGKYERISKIESYIKDNEELAGLVIFGAPEKTNKTLAEMMDEQESGRFPFPVVSFFPQDDILGTQYTSDLVIDYSGNSESSEDLENETVHVIPNFDTAKAISRTILAMIRNKGPFETNDALIDTAKEIIGEGHSVSRYVDSETQIPAMNHFTFEN